MEKMKKSTQKTKILFLCTGNSCRSQMAEGWARHIRGDEIDAYSAGIEVHGLNPHAVKVMNEAGINISHQRSKHINEVKDIAFDYIITVCQHIHELCPLSPFKVKTIHQGFDDPPMLAKDAKNQEEALNHFRRVRDEIKAFIRKLPMALEK